MPFDMSKDPFADIVTELDIVAELDIVEVDALDLETDLDDFADVAPIADGLRVLYG